MGWLALQASPNYNEKRIYWWRVGVQTAMVFREDQGFEVNQGGRPSTVDAAAANTNFDNGKATHSARPRAGQRVGCVHPSSHFGRAGLRTC